MKSAAIDDTGCSQLPLSGYLLGAARNSGELFMGLRPTRAGMKIIEAQLYSMNAPSVIQSRPIEYPRPDGPRRGEGGGRFGHQVRVLTQCAQRAIQKIFYSSLRYAS